MSVQQYFKEELSGRDAQVLRLVVRYYVANAIPVGSESLVRHSNLQWSSATIRNIFARLEDLGYIEHPHTSAGRMPTEKGYRFFVNTLEDLSVTNEDAQAIQDFQFSTPNSETLFREVSQLLGKISGQLGLIAASYTSAGVVHKIELIPLSSTRILVVLAIRSGFVKSVVLEVQSEIPAEKLEMVAQRLTERLHGRALSEWRNYFDDYVRTSESVEASIVQMILCAPGLFDDPFDMQAIYVSGAPNVLLQPEFKSGEQLHNIMELIDDEPSVAGVLYEHAPAPDTVAVRIGSEHSDARLHNCSSIAAQYQWGDVAGMIGLIGPTRLQYDRLAPLVSYLARTLSSARI
jgi:heat-inducible transcriptional repressor